VCACRSACACANVSAEQTYMGVPTHASMCGSAGVCWPTWLVPSQLTASRAVCFAQICAFLDKLSELRSLQPMHSSMTRAMANLYGFDQAKNYEIRMSWYKVRPGW